MACQFGANERHAVQGGKDVQKVRHGQTAWRVRQGSGAETWRQDIDIDTEIEPVGGALQFVASLADGLSGISASLDAGMVSASDAGARSSTDTAPRPPSRATAESPFGRISASSVVAPPRHGAPTLSAVSGSKSNRREIRTNPIDPISRTTPRSTAGATL